jgi:hypothetical protein
MKISESSLHADVGGGISGAATVPFRGKEVLGDVDVASASACASAEERWIVWFCRLAMVKGKENERRCEDACISQDGTRES